MKALISIVLLLLAYSSLAIESVDPIPFSAADTELMAPVEGGKVYVRINGELDKGDIPMIFLHGGPGLRHNSLAGLLGLADERQLFCMTS
jgi:proline iminopeptidase/L-proline amide hydrolase